MGIERCWNLESLNQNQALEYIMSKDNKDGKKYVEALRLKTYSTFSFSNHKAHAWVEMIFIYFLTMGGSRKMSMVTRKNVG